MEFKDYYKTLELAKTATPDEIKKSFRKLARKYHPDVSKAANATERMAELNEANDVLSDPEKRMAYDSLSDSAQNQDGRDFRPPPNWDAGFEFSDANGQGGMGGTGRDGSHSDFFEQLFGRAARSKTGNARNPGSLRGQDHHAKIELDLLDAFNGTDRSLSLRRARVDDGGQVINETHELQVAIPKGVYAGQHVRLKGHGGPGYGDEPAGDLLLEVVFKPDARWRAQVRDVYQQVRLSPWEAMLGVTLSIQTPGGEVEVVFPAYWKPGRKLRLKGRGIPGTRGTDAGDVYLESELALPPANTGEARAAYAAMAAAFPRYDPRRSPETAA